MGEFTGISILSVRIKIWQDIRLSPYQLSNAKLLP